MDNVSRPLIALLVGTVALFALYFVALRGSSTQGTNKQSLKGFQSDISAAHKAVGIANHAAGAAGGSLARPSNAPAGSATSRSASAASPGSTKPASSGRTSDASKAQAVHAAKSAPPSSRAAKQARVKLVSGALAHKKVLALLFYNPAASDDRAVKRELATVPTHRGLVVKLAVPISELASYQAVDTQIPVNQTPTLVLIDRQHEATTIVGFADSLEISQRVADAVAAK